MTTMIGCLRVSTEEQAHSGLGLEAQRETIQRYADSHGWNVVWYEDAGVSAKSLDRPQWQAALARLHPKKRDVQGIVVAKLDRLSRSVQDFSGLLKLADARRWSLVAIDLGVGTSTGGLDWARKVDSDDRAFFRTTLELEAGDPFWTRDAPEELQIRQREL
jgi:DNA invertase Pin-like site-specific DNA recombinase